MASSIVTEKLEAKARVGAGKGFARRTRAEGLIPGVVYGKHLDKPMSIAVNAKAVRQAVHGKKKLNTVIGLSVGGKEHMVMLKDYQLDPVSKDLLHVDFIDVRETEQLKVKIPVVLTGKSAGVLEGGILTQMRRELEVYALPASIPEQIEIDISHLKIAQVLHINDVTLPAGVKVKTNVNYTIAVVTAPEVEKVAEPTAAAAAAPAAGDKAAAAPAAAGKPAAGADKAAAAKPAAGGKK
jgi:large subunit ribosomal protein L25